MLSFLTGLLRVSLGFVLACLAAGFIIVLFAFTPAKLIDADAVSWGETGILALQTATMAGYLALYVATLPIISSEVMGIRHIFYHCCVGIATAVAGVGLLISGESSEMPTILYFYAVAAFLTTGLFAGFVYWLFAGRWAYRSPGRETRMRATALLYPSSPIPPASPAQVPSKPSHDSTTDPLHSTEHSTEKYPLQPDNRAPASLTKPHFPEQFPQPDDKVSTPLAQPPQSDATPQPPSQSLEKEQQPPLEPHQNQQYSVNKEQNGHSPETKPEERGRLPSVHKPNE
ncbi:MAG: hypothetical protein AAFR90_11090 [Pseudomonadota bacterium]